MLRTVSLMLAAIALGASGAAGLVTSHARFASAPAVSGPIPPVTPAKRAAKIAPQAPVLQYFSGETAASLTAAAAPVVLRLSSSDPAPALPPPAPPAGYVSPHALPAEPTAAAAPAAETPRELAAQRARITDFTPWKTGVYR
ncbi:hypothetical protein [Rhodobacter viridis]|nr:hypothetical protein [Rhodobacter viridis]